MCLCISCVIPSSLTSVIAQGGGGNRRENVGEANTNEDMEHGKRREGRRVHRGVDVVQPQPQHAMRESDTPLRPGVAQADG